MSKLFSGPIASLREPVELDESVSVEMNVKEDTSVVAQDKSKKKFKKNNYLNYYCPFFPNSVNLISASTNSGKTTLLKNILVNKKNCFVRPFDRVLVVLCNEKVDAQDYLQLSNKSLQVDTIYLSEFDPETYLSSNLVVIFEDVLTLNDLILNTVNVYAHHLDLNSVFLVTQSILREEEFKSLLSLSHRVIIFFSGVAGSKLGLYIKKLFFVNSEIKDYLKRIISFAEKTKANVLFELNDIRGQFETKYFAIVNFQGFFDRPIDKVKEDHDENTTNEKETFIFPKLNEMYDYDQKFSDFKVELAAAGDLPLDAYVLVKTNNVLPPEKKLKKEESNAKRDWEAVNTLIIDDINDGIRPACRQSAKNIAKSILNSKYFLVSKDGKSLMIKNSPKSSISLMDYLNVASRLAVPNEKFDQNHSTYVQISKLLLMSKTPKFFIRNKNLFLRKPAAARNAAAAARNVVNK